jgi:PAS domain S-box-containing protein
MQYVVFAALTPAAAAVLLLIAALAWRRRTTPPAATLLWLTLTTFGWLVFNTLELVLTSSWATLWCARITYVFLAWTPLAWLAFAFQYVDERKWLERPRLVPLAVVPFTTSLIALTSATHELLWAEYRLIPNRGLLHLWIVQYGPWFWVNALYGYTCVLVGAALIIAHYVQASRLYRRQASWTVVGALCLLVVNAAYVLRLIPGWRKDYTPIAFTFAGLLFAIGVLRYRLLDLRPVGRSQLVESMRDGVIVVGKKHRIVDVNPAARRILGDPEEDLLGEPLPDVLPVVAPLLAPSPSGSAVQSDVLINTRGEQRHYEIRASDITDGQGRCIGRLVVLRDVTERIETRRQLRRQERLAAIGQLAGGVAHDFNNLLGSIMLNAQLARQSEDELPEIVEDSLDVIIQESRHGAELVAQILDFSRSGLMESRPLDLGRFVHDVASVLRRTIREDIHLVVETPSEPCVVDADPTRIQQMLLNLATNARDAMPRGGELRITVERLPGAPADDGSDGRVPPAERAHLVVSDTGIGMDEEIQEHLFEPFFTTKEPDQGTGLGLAQVYGIVRQHDGRIEVDTAPGQGATFHITLPLHHAMPKARESEGIALELEGRGETVLLVEDEEGLREASREALTSLGYRVLAAASARQALERLDGHRVNLVITDVVMPEMGGEALLRELTRRSPGVPVLAVTGYPIRDDVEQLRELGFSDVLCKPFDAPTLARAVHRNLYRDGL